jgi:outer membrane protein OmpA-like peptidoglycan-associated protein
MAQGMRYLVILLLLGSVYFAVSVSAQQETEVQGLTASLEELRQFNGVLRLKIALKNSGDKASSGSTALEYGKIMLIDAQSKQKHFGLKDADGHFLAGPISDWNGGGRWFPKVAKGETAFVWVLFEPVASGSKVSVQVPLMLPFDDVLVKDSAPSNTQVVQGSMPPLKARLISARRAEGKLRVNLKISNPSRTVAAGGAIRYTDVFVLDPKSKRKYPPLKDTEGIYQAQPLSDKNDGGRWFASYARPETETLMSIMFPAPPDAVNQVDIVVPGFLPFEAVPLVGSGGASDGGIGVAGQSMALEGVLKDLNAEVTPQEIKINLAADVLFDFDKADLKPEADPQLEKVVTVLRAYPTSQVEIDGHTDGKGSANYNQELSERRAATVAKWLAAHSGPSSASLHTIGFGATRPIAPNTKQDGSDNPEGRAKNRRVEIVVRK